MFKRSSPPATLLILLCFLTTISCHSDQPAPSSAAKVQIFLDAKSPHLSYGVVTASKQTFPVGLGRNGFLPAGTAFKGGYSLLGRFKVSAMLSGDRFEMTPELIEQSGKSADWLRDNLFSNMSSIDFDGDGKGGEYGQAFIGLVPVDSSAKQPFHFGSYKGTFRWYSFAIHGTQDESRIGKCATGGCINVKQENLVPLTQQLKLGDLITIAERKAK